MPSKNALLPKSTRKRSFKVHDAHECHLGQSNSLTPERRMLFTKLYERRYLFPETRKKLGNENLAILAASGAIHLTLNDLQQLSLEQLLAIYIGRPNSEVKNMIAEYLVEIELVKMENEWNNCCESQTEGPVDPNRLTDGEFEYWGFLGLTP